MKGKKRIILILIFIFLLLFLVFLIWFFSQKKDLSKDKIQPLVSPPASIPSRLEFGILEILPKEDLSITHDFSQPFEVTFSEKVLPENFFYKTEPLTKTKMRQGKDEYSIFIYPELRWEDGTTTITILQETKSVQGNTLKKPFVYKIKTEFTPPPIVSPGVDY